MRTVLLGLCAQRDDHDGVCAQTSLRFRPGEVGELHAALRLHTGACREYCLRNDKYTGQPGNDTTQRVVSPGDRGGQGPSDRPGDETGKRYILIRDVFCRRNFRCRV